MNHYVTHHFAHVETLKRAERWLLQCGFQTDQIEVHREGVPRLSVLCSPDRSAEVSLILNAVEAGDPDGWPGIWDIARMPHPHVEPTPDATSTEVFTARPTPVGWHPTDVRLVAEGPRELTEIWDVNTRFL
jgi:hypothetical protein